MMGRIVTLKGVVAGSESHKVFMFDSSVENMAWRVVDFDAINLNTLASRYNTDCFLHSESREDIVNDPANLLYAWDSNQVIAYSKNGTTGSINKLVDLNHVVVSNLILKNESADPVGFLIILEQMKITPQENIIYQTKERAQS